MARSLEEANNVAATQNNRDTAIAEISRLLLEGWTLLGDVCPLANCNTPLVRNRNTGVTMCCHCRAQVVRSINPLESSGIHQESGLPTHVRSSLAVSHEEQVNGANDQGQFFSSLETDYIREFQRDSDRVSRQIGEKLLQGWTLLDTNCPNPQCACPLMRDDQGALFCVSCQQFREENHQREMQVENRASGEVADVDSLENKRPRITSDGAATNSLDVVNSGDSILRKTEAALLGKIDLLQATLSQSGNMQEWTGINEQLSSFLSNLQKVRSLRNVHPSQLS
ncbi:hypothetical protein GpartN1_g5467.t1 [Galdieria partita]|uniref:Uncharacterized protein n=1 Tax=Galdieria partita TaxID=83374 RepID=A0A9C7US52_9RHOD|nr:hypothetical protein GpartN1_g5467.t1 [Galdieria partita]